MAASPQEIMAARLFFNAAFPTMQVLIDDKYDLKKKFCNFSGTVQFGAKNDGELLACHMIFDNGKLTVKEGPAEKADLTINAPESLETLKTGGSIMEYPRERVENQIEVLGLNRCLPFSVNTTAVNDSPCPCVTERQVVPIYIIIHHKRYDFKSKFSLR